MRDLTETETDLVAAYARELREAGDTRETIDAEIDAMIAEILEAV